MTCPCRCKALVAPWYTFNGDVEKANDVRQCTKPAKVDGYCHVHLGMRANLEARDAEIAVLVATVADLQKKLKAEQQRAAWMKEIRRCCRNHDSLSEESYDRDD